MSLPAAHDARVAAWLHTLEARHLADLRFAEVTRALRALSSAYVERRATLAERGAFDSAGKRAAYALYYGPLHFLAVCHIVHTLPGARDPLAHVVDWGCGTGAAGAAWATALAPAPRVTGIDSHPWALTEAAATYRTFGLDAEVTRTDLAATRLPRKSSPAMNAAKAGSAGGVIAGWVVNEVDGDVRRTLRDRLIEAASRGTRVLVVEPIATRVSPWWPEWVEAFAAIGGRADEWRFAVELPDLVKRLDHAAGMRHDQLKARTLWVAVTEKSRGRESSARSRRERPTPSHRSPRR